MALIYLGGLTAALQFGKVTLLLPAYAEAFGRDVTGVAVLVSLVGVMGLALGAMAGGIVAAIGPGRSFVGGLVAGGAVSVLSAFAPGFWSFAGMRAVEGLAHLALVVAGPPLMAAAASDRHRPLAMGLWGTFFGTALALAGLALPWLMDAGGLTLVLVASGAVMLVLAVPVRLRAPRLPRLPRTAVAIDPIAVHRSVYGRFAQAAPGLSFVCYTFLFLACLTFLPEALDRPSAASLWSTITLASTLAGGAVCRVLPPRRVAAVGYLGTLAAGAGAWAGVPLAAEAAFLAMGLIPGACFAAIAAWNEGPRERARATGAIAQFGNLGTVSGTPVLALAYAGGGRDGLMAAVCAAALLGAALSVWAGARVSRSAAASPPAPSGPAA